MALVTIKHRLDLMISLTDSASGRPVGGRVALRKNGSPLSFYRKEAGRAMLMNEGREDFDLEVDAEGYEPEKLRVDYAGLAGDLPMMELYLMPQDRYGNEYATFEGCLPGIVAAEAAKAGSSAWTAGSYDERKRLLAIQSVYRSEPDGSRYALIAPDQATFEPVEFAGKSEDGVYRLASPLLSESVEGRALSRRVQGKVSGDNYLLRLPRDGTAVCWILRIATGAGESFQTVAIGESETGTGLSPRTLEVSPQTTGITRNNIGMKGG
ncbi:MAG: hypothetical protein LBS91_00515 [Clostridiales Family XIII bacterium]|jgi:hypothetical protein|nr:hypothetical protein [Clostridiales Family XIII bacterium]